MIQILSAFSLYVSGVAWVPDIEGTCTCSKPGKGLCAVTKIHLPGLKTIELKHQMIVLVDANRNPVSGVVNVTCMRAK